MTTPFNGNILRSLIQPQTDQVAANLASHMRQLNIPSNQPNQYYILAYLLGSPGTFGMSANNLVPGP